MITRPENDAAEVSALVKKSGFQPILSPVMRIEFNNATGDYTGAGAIAFTSANGVRAVEAGKSIQRDLPVFAVGDITAAAARNAGFKDVTAAGGDVRSLVGAITKAARAGAFHGAVLHPAGAEQRGDLVAALKALGVRAKRVVAYKASAIEMLAPDAAAALADARPAEWVVLFSPRSAGLFLAQVRRAGLIDSLKKIRAACLSPAVAETAAAAVWSEIYVAEDRSAHGVVAVIAARGRAG